MSILEKTVNKIGLIHLSAYLNISHQSVKKWMNKNCLPRTEFTGETQYAQLIEKATGGKIKAKDLLDESLREYKKKRKK
jgi:DNA-binding transcriptional regulator YiaG